MATRTDVTKVQSFEIGAEPAARTARSRWYAPILAAFLLAAVAVGAVNASAGPSAEELEQAHWQAVVEHYSGLHQTMARTSAAEAAYWEQVVDFHAAQWAQR